MTKSARNWSIPTVLSHLQAAYFDATGADIMDVTVTEGLTVEEMVGELKEHHLRTEMLKINIPGQLRIKADEVTGDIAIEVTE